MASLNPVWLEDFLALAATFNFSRAAEMRATTQPAFSRRIRALQDWLGVALIDRHVQPSVLTDAGAWFVKWPASSSRASSAWRRTRVPSPMHGR